MAWGYISICALSVTTLLCAFEEDSKLERLKRKINANLLIIRKESAVKKIANETLDFFISYSTSAYNYQQKSVELLGTSNTLQKKNEQLQKTVEQLEQDNRKLELEISSTKQTLHSKKEIQSKEYLEKNVLHQELVAAQERVKALESELTVLKQHLMQTQDPAKEPVLALAESAPTASEYIDTIE